MKYYSKKTVEQHKEKNSLRITFACSDKKEWATLLEKVKTLKGRRFNQPFPKAWAAPDTEENLQSLIGWGFELKGEKKKTEEPKLPIEVFTKHQSIEIPEEGFELLYDYQVEALQFLVYFQGRGLIALPPGAGKTFVALYYAKLFPEKRSLLIVCPAPIKSQWARECDKVLQEEVTILDSKTPYLPRRSDIYIINWDIIDAWKDVLCQMRFEIVVSDEIQAIGSSKSKRTKAYKEIIQAQGCDHIPMSGTPFNSKVRQFYNVLNILAPKKFPTEWSFWNRYCDPTYGAYGLTYNGASHIDELRGKITRLMYRKEKSEIFEGAPVKQRIVVPMEISDEAMYKEITGNAEEQGLLSPSDQLMYLQRSAFYLKQDNVIHWIKDFLENTDKLVVYAWHRAVIEYVHSQFPKNSVKVYGGMNTAAKDEAKRKFIEDDGIKLYIVNIGTCPGIDGLQHVCSDGAFVELAPTESAMEQAEDRIDRIGQKYMPKMYYLVSAGTIDERYAEILEKNSKVNDELLKGGKGNKISILDALEEK